MSASPKARGGQSSELTKLKLLTPAEQETIWNWRDELVDGRPLTNAQIRKRIAEQFSVRLKWDSQLSDFWEFYGLRQQVAKNESVVATLLADFKSANPEATPEKIEAVGQAFFTALALQQQDAQTWVATQRLNLDRSSARTRFELEKQKLAQAERKIVLLEKKAAAFDQAKEVVESKLSPEEQRARLKEILK